MHPQAKGLSTQNKKARRRPLGVAALSVALLSACVSVPQSSDEQTLESVRPPQVQNLTPFPHLTLAGVDQFGEYTSLALKISYALQADGQLLPLRRGQEPMVDEHTPIEDNFECQPHGARFNQVTTWYPDTGVFVRGAQLSRVLNRAGQARPLLALEPREHGLMGAIGAHPDALVYAYVPCVGEHRVAQGMRSEGHLAPGDRLQLQTDAGAELSVVLPDYPRPVVWLDFADRAARAIAPAELVLLTVDVPRQRVVAQYQLTVAMRPPVREATWSAVLPSDALADHPERQQINAAVADVIRRCEPSTRPMPSCTFPHQRLPELLQP